MFVSGLWLTGDDDPTISSASINYHLKLMILSVGRTCLCRLVSCRSCCVAFLNMISSLYLLQPLALAVVECRTLNIWIPVNYSVLNGPMDWWSHTWSKLIVIDPGYSWTHPLMEPYTNPIPPKKTSLLATIVLWIVDAFTARGKGHMYYYVLFFLGDWGISGLLSSPTYTLLYSVLY